jgi:hypothetical protein
MSGTKGTPATAGTQATEMTPTAAKMPQTVLTPTSRDFRSKFAKKTRLNGENSSKKLSQNRPFLSDTCLLFR